MDRLSMIRSMSRVPAVTHAVDRRNAAKRRIQRDELAANALDVRSDGAVVDDDAGVAHQAVAILDMAGESRHRMHHPELGQGEIDAPAVPLGGQALKVERK